MLKIKSDEIKKKKEIGSLDNAPVHHIEMVGGLNLIVHQKNGGVNVLGAGPSKAIAMFMAKKDHKIQISELNKSEQTDAIGFSFYETEAYAAKDVMQKAFDMIKGDQK